MDTMDILMDMGMDITVDKHNNQNAKIGLERTPKLSSSNFNQKINSTMFKIKECQKYTAKYYNVSTYFTFAIFSPFAKMTLWIQFWSIKNTSFTIFPKKKTTMQQN